MADGAPGVQLWKGGEFVPQVQPLAAGLRKFSAAPEERGVVPAGSRKRSCPRPPCVGVVAKWDFL